MIKVYHDATVPVCQLKAKTRPRLYPLSKIQPWPGIILANLDTSSSHLMKKIKKSDVQNANGLHEEDCCLSHEWSP